MSIMQHFTESKILQYERIQSEDKYKNHLRIKRRLVFIIMKKN